MKKYLLILFFSLITLFSNGQSKNDSICYNIDNKIEYLCRITYCSYELYETTNMYNFIKLDHENGKMTLVQWSTDNSKEFEYELNDRDLRPSDEQKLFIPNRFKLYKTSNIYTFILLDKVNGNCYHVQWNFDKNKRFVKIIY